MNQYRKPLPRCECAIPDSSRESGYSTCGKPAVAIWSDDTESSNKLYVCKKHDAEIEAQEEDAE